MSVVTHADYLSAEEYLLGENDREDGERYEYVNGKTYLMAGASRAHNHVAMKFSALLFNHLENSTCDVFQSDMKVFIQTLEDTRFYYPDIQVSCETEEHSHYNTAPCLIIEVLSGSTAYKDRTEKLAAYRLIPSLQEYLLCSQEAPYIECYRRANNWQAEVFVAGQRLSLTSIDLQVEIDELYRFLSSGQSTTRP